MSSHIYHACLPRFVPNPAPLPLGEGGLVPSQIQPLSLWERVAEGRVRAPQQPCLPHSVPYPAGQLIWHPHPNPLPEGEGVGGRTACLHPHPNPLPRERGSEGGLLALGTLTPTLSQRERGSEGGLLALGTLTPTLSQRERGSEGGLLDLGTLTPTLSQRERGSEGCETNLRDKSSEQEPQ